VRAKLTFVLNGVEQTVDTEPRRLLLEVLREDLELTGTKYGCGEGQCGACTVLVDGAIRRSCLTSLEQVAGKEVLTIEGVATEAGLHPVQQAFVEHEALQCGYCVPGMVITAVELLRRKPDPSREEVVQEMNGNLCRCCGYVRIVDAVLAAAEIGRRSGR
jgi:aerobic-type carbon monoxide dehydrogenase small subunit (CoxS/CutS family)